ncbi:MAG: DNA polymerase III subunit delta [Chloroflexi bacterium]|nr:DNA polymerase III subunit delta [Chloroflexota bacterium]
MENVARVIDRVYNRFTMYYIFHGEDELSRTEQLEKFHAQMGDPQFADLNTRKFDHKVSLSELQHACNAMPFLADKRLVIVAGLLARLDPRRKSDESGEAVEEDANPVVSKELKEYLAHLPDHTRLVFVESKTLAKNNPIFKHAESDKNATVKEFSAPDLKNLAAWIRARVKSKNAEIEPEAVGELSAHLGNDLRLLDNEIEKLITFRAHAPIRGQDVRALVASVREADIFALVDAIGKRDTRLALKLLHEHISQNAAPQYLLTMIVRQFRMLLQMKDLATRKQTVDVAREQLRLHPFVAQKTWQQAMNFTLPQLEAIYHKLLDADLAMKTSRSEPVATLDVLLVELTR